VRDGVQRKGGLRFGEVLAGIGQGVQARWGHRPRVALLAVRSTDPMVDYLPSTVESLRTTILRLGLLNEGDLIDSSRRVGAR
jgi:hypothetical protein